jgi:hypothetical protein
LLADLAPIKVHFKLDFLKQKGELVISNWLNVLKKLDVGYMIILTRKIKKEIKDVEFVNKSYKI